MGSPHEQTLHDRITVSRLSGNFWSDIKRLKIAWDGLTCVLPIVTLHPLLLKIKLDLPAYILHISNFFFSWNGKIIAKVTRRIQRRREVVRSSWSVWLCRFWTVVATNIPWHLCFYKIVMESDKTRSVKKPVTRRTIPMYITATLKPLWMNHSSIFRTLWNTSAHQFSAVHV